MCGSCLGFNGIVYYSSNATIISGLVCNLCLDVFACLLYEATLGNCPMTYRYGMLATRYIECCGIDIFLHSRCVVPEAGFSFTIRLDRFSTTQLEEIQSTFVQATLKDIGIIFQCQKRNKPEAYGINYQCQKRRNIEGHDLAMPEMK